MISITDKEFNQIKDILHEKTGIFLQPTKKKLVLSRLMARLEELKFRSFEEYICYLLDVKTKELEKFINALTTNETYFFRCEKQFDFLKNKIFPQIIEQKKNDSNPKIQIWSAGCSNGAEAYSIAILIKEYFSLDPSMVKIYATDINSEVLEEAKQGIYKESFFKEMPPYLKHKYFKKLNQEKYGEKLYAIDDQIKKYVLFFKHNLKNLFIYRALNLVIFRNVMIYFDKETKIDIIRKLEKVITPQGYLILSLSETLMGVNSNFIFEDMGIYQYQPK